MNGNNLAHGANKDARGNNLIDAQDADGKYFMRERVALARQQTSFWQDYKYLNPVTRKRKPNRAASSGWTISSWDVGSISK